MFNNEEAVKNRLAGPYLRSPGFDECEISYEKGSSLPVGRDTSIFTIITCPLSSFSLQPQQQTSQYQG